MYSRRFRAVFFAAFSASILVLAGSPLIAWTGPTATPPGNNVSAPINVGGVSQLKNGTLGVNGLGVFGNTILDGINGDGNNDGVNGYLNFGATSGSNGYGFRDNAGAMEYKNSSGTWGPIGGGGSTWVSTWIAVPMSTVNLSSYVPADATGVQLSFSTYGNGDGAFYLDGNPVCGVGGISGVNTYCSGSVITSVGTHTFAPYAGGAGNVHISAYSH